MLASPIAFLELNEVNFEYVQTYAARGLLPNFKKFFDTHGFTETESEPDFENQEPWIQWVTAHTGLTLGEHRVFRLGDIVNSDIEQVWEKLAAKGIKVGAISPMNAKCRGSAWDFFIPDPWTKTDVIASPIVSRMYAAIAQAVNDNAQSRVTAKSAFDLLLGAAITAAPSNYLGYVSLVAGARGKPWKKAMFLDRLLADLYISLVRSKKTQFSTLFLNSAAHIQHHYMFSSAAHDTDLKNPNWYIKEKIDPLLEAYQIYDQILADIQSALPGYRIMIATALHQELHPQATYFWRPKNHSAFLNKLGLEFVSVQPRMSRDFLVTFKNVSDAESAERILKSTIADDGHSMFEIDNRGHDLFVSLVYPGDVNLLSGYRVGNQHFTNLIEDVSFVAIRNGQHNGIGYFADSGVRLDPKTNRFSLAQMPSRVIEAFAS